MLNTDTKSLINSARDILVGKVPDPKGQIENITLALIYKFMDDMDTEAVEKLGGKAKYFTGDFAKYSWRKLFDPKLGGHDMLALYRESLENMHLNPNIPDLFKNIFKNAFLSFNSPETLKLFLKTINEFNYCHSENLGNAYEYLLSVLGTQGDAGQFRTPRHIIDFIVECVAPQKNESVLDPACGTAGFILAAYKHILRNNKKVHDGDKLTPDERKRIAGNLVGFDIDPNMVRFSLVNMFLHKFQTPHIYEYDTLSSEDRWNEYYDVILANPPFMTPKGGIKPHKRFSIQATKSEVLFTDYMAEHLTPNGRAGIIVPNGIIATSQTAYKNLRKMLVENSLVAVISLPTGVFNPYSGVKTSVLLLDKALSKKTDSILFIKVENDGYDLGAQRREIDKNDLPEAIRIFNEFKTSILAKTEFTIDEKSIATLVKKEKLLKNKDVNLSVERYKESIIFNNIYPLLKIGEICSFEYGKPLKEENRIYGDYPVFGSNGIVGFHNEYLVEAPFIIVGRKGTAGAVVYSEKNGFPIDTTFYVKIKNVELVHPKYLYYILKASDLGKINEQAGVPGLNRNDAYEKEIPIPPLQIQQQIVAEIEGKQRIYIGCKCVI
jgi:type I restriction enzyme M protein